MARRRKKGMSKALARQETARLSQKKLLHVLENGHQYDPRIVRSAAKHLSRLSQRHRLGIPTEAKHLLCRKCKIPHIYSSTARVRIHQGMRVITCLECGYVRRFGGGPGFHKSTR